MQDNESLREFVKRFGQAVLQVEACSMDAVLQIFKRSICPGTPFFESLAKKPPTTMDDLFRRANKYSMLEDDVRAATQQVLVAGRASRGDPERNAKPPDRPRPSDRKRKRQKLLRVASIREHINSIRPGLTGGSPRPIDGTIIFPPVDPTRTLQPHRDALILSLEIGDFDVRRILVDPGSSVDLVQASVVGRTWLHYMKVIPSTYHQMVSFLTEEGQIDLYGSQLAARQCYQIAREAGTSQEDAPLPEPSNARTHLTNISSLMTPQETQIMQNALRQNHDIFAWAHSDMEGIHPSITSHRLNVFPTARPIQQKIRRFHPDRQKVIRNEIDKLLEARFIREVDYPDWLANVVVVPKKEGKWRVCVDYTNLNNACPKDSFPLPRIDQIVDSIAGQGMLSFLDALSGYHQILMSPADEEKTAFITPYDLYCYKVMSFGLKNAGATY
ncbi:Transposon Ty3-I Gag-Pol polyprotein [Vitis vinifera]|uniref:Transposon Ty3-I Gag-Pol polyprotein n=1 Tax=Vitis vinifera TaxID=29760 RepID=A0A438FHW7_VITVI|nr:Transposon Ty3-I Gag-Pol polyprotein [Vitis vinifera]